VAKNILHNRYDCEFSHGLEGPPSTSYGPRFHKDVDADLRRHDGGAAATGQYLGPLVVRRETGKE
jgi:hypothetical protein